MRVVDYVPDQYHYAMGDADRAYSPRKLRRFTREIVYVPGPDVFFVFDRVVSQNPSFRKAWLLHGVNKPSVDQNARMFRFNDGAGELTVHSLLPHEVSFTPRGGPGNEFYTPGDEHGGQWGSGQNWPLEPPQGGPLPDDPELRHMWKTFWGDDFSQILSSNHKNVVPGAWRVEVSPGKPAEEDFFLHVLEIGNQGTTGHKRVKLLDGANLSGAAFESGPVVVFSTTDFEITTGEVSLPDLGCDWLLITGLQPDSVYELNFAGLNIAASPVAIQPGIPVSMLRIRSNEKGIMRVDVKRLGNLRLRIARV
jgi:heparin/heparan-sulfate lyase